MQIIYQNNMDIGTIVYIVVNNHFITEHNFGGFALEWQLNGRFGTKNSVIHVHLWLYANWC